MSKGAKPSEAKKSLKKMLKFLGAKFRKAALKRLKAKKALTDAGPSAEPFAAATGADVPPPLPPPPGDDFEGPFALGEKVRI